MYDLFHSAAFLKFIHVGGINNMIMILFIVIFCCINISQIAFPLYYSQILQLLTIFDSYK